MDYLYILIITIVIGIFLFLNTENRYYNIDKIKSYLFNIVSIIFIIIFIFYTYKKGSLYGGYITVVIWAFFVTLTPVPEAGLLLTFPIKHFFGINMYISQIVISLLAILILIYTYYVKPVIIKSSPIGKIFMYIVKNKLYTILFISIISSIIGSYLLDELLKYIENKDYFNKTNKYSIIVFLLFLFLNVIYLKTIIQTDTLKYIKNRNYI